MSFTLDKIRWYSICNHLYHLYRIMYDTSMIRYISRYRKKRDERERVEYPLSNPNRTQI